MTLADLSIDSSWTLFLDRDGVINAHTEGVYVTSFLDLKLLPGVTAAIAQLSHQFGRVVVVTNQQAIGKGLLAEEELLLMHELIQMEVRSMGGKVDLFLYAPELQSAGTDRRKPGVGMGLEAQQRFPEINFVKSIMVGDSPSDILFGKRLGMKTVFVQNPWKTCNDADFQVDSLVDFSRQLTSAV